MYSKTVFGLMAFCLLSATFVNALNLGALTSNVLCNAVLVTCEASQLLGMATASASDIATYLVGTNCVDVLPVKQCLDSAIRSIACMGVVSGSIISTADSTANSIASSCTDVSAVTPLVQTLLNLANSIG